MQFNDTKEILAHFAGMASSILSLPDKAVSEVSQNVLKALAPHLDQVDKAMRGKDINALATHLLSKQASEENPVLEAIKSNLSLMVLKLGFAFALDFEGKIQVQNKENLLSKLELIFKPFSHKIEHLEEKMEKNKELIRGLVRDILSEVQDTSLSVEDADRLLEEFSKKASEEDSNVQQDVDLLLADLVAIAWAIVDKEKQPNIEMILRQMAPWVKQKRSLVNLERFKEKNTAMTKRMLEEILTKVDSVKGELGSRLAKTVTPESAYEETPQVQVHKYASLEDKQVERLFSSRSNTKQTPDNKSTEVWDYLKSPKGKGSDPLKEVLGGR